MNENFSINPDKTKTIYLQQRKKYYEIKIHFLFPRIKYNCLPEKKYLF